MRSASKQVRAMGASQSSGSSCVQGMAGEYVQHCRQVLQQCVAADAAGQAPCACDMDGVVPARNSSGGWGAVATGRPGCAAHTSTWHQHTSAFCYVTEECGTAQRAHDWSNVRWKPCTELGICPTGCQAAIDALLAVPAVEDCVTDSAQRQVRPQLQYMADASAV